MGSIQVEGLGKAYKKYPSRWSRLLEWTVPFGKPRHQLHWVLQDINFHVDRGEALGVIGINGAGKSTLLKMITGTTQPTTGHVNITGRVAALLELGMGFHADFTGRQNVYMAGQLLGMGMDEIGVLMPEIEAFAEIGDYIDQAVRMYSSGMQVRLAFAVATAVRPDILIVDEALAVGDAYFQHKCSLRIRQFQEQGTTLLFVSHDPATVRAFCKKAIWLDQGRLRRFGDAKDVLDAYATALYAKEQDVDNVDKYFKAAGEEVRESMPKRDCRLDFINHSNLRNDIQVFTFDNDATRWGDGLARITGVYLQDASGAQLSWMIGGEEVELVVMAQAIKNLVNVIIGFQVRDKLGQVLFGDNTYLTTLDSPVTVKGGGAFKASFRFQMPILPKGSYAVAAAVAVGSQQEHVIHEWINDALFFESHNGVSVSGLVGVPMHGVEIGECISHHS